MPTLRRVEGVTYWVINEPTEIRKLINQNIRHEWERDAEHDGIDPTRDPWLLGLSKLEWSLRTVRTSDVKVDVSLMSNRAFVHRLQERSRQLRRGILQYDAVIWPMVVRGDDLMLKDGYSRYTTLKGMGMSKTLVYFGR
ncbi:MAG: hypothetical protein HY296_02440 [Thaumarchaeota archaeon]|nr:hypothetical protein [Nitrososphaerota archaeon]